MRQLEPFRRAGHLALDNPAIDQRRDDLGGDPRFGERVFFRNSVPRPGRSQQAILDEFPNRASIPASPRK